MPRGFAPPNNPPGRVHTAGSRTVYHEMRTHFPSFPITATSAFSSTCCSCCCCCCHRCSRGVHTTTPCDLKSPFRYARQGCPRLYFHRGASAAAVLPSFRRDTTLPACSYAFFTIGKFRRWWYSSPPCRTFGGWLMIPAGLPLCPALDAGLHLNQLIESKALLQYPRPLRCTGAYSSPLRRAFVSPVQSALLPGSPRIDGCHVLIIGLPKGRDKED